MDLNELITKLEEIRRQRRGDLLVTNKNGYVIQSIDLDTARQPQYQIEQTTVVLQFVWVNR